MFRSPAKQDGVLLLLPAAGLAIVVVFGLLFLMQALINADQGEPVSYTHLTLPTKA